MDLKGLSYDGFKDKLERSMKCVPYLKNYGDKFYKLIVLKSDFDYGCRKRSEKGSINENKLENNLIRAKGRVFEMALCNDWDWFVTLTLDSKKYDRYNLKKYIDDLSRFIRNQRRKGMHIEYCLVPEQHKDGAWHLHGFMKGLPENDILPTGYKGKDGQAYLHWLPYYNKFGYMSMDKIQDAVKISFYMTKYISKTMLDTNMELGAHLYYASRGLKGADESQCIDFVDAIDYAKFNMRYEDNFCEVYNLSVEDAEQLLNRR